MERKLEWRVVLVVGLLAVVSTGCSKPQDSPADGSPADSTEADVPFMVALDGLPWRVEPMEDQTGEKWIAEPTGDHGIVLTQRFAASDFSGGPIPGVLEAFVPTTPVDDGSSLDNPTSLRGGDRVWESVNATSILNGEEELSPDKYARIGRSLFIVPGEHALDSTSELVLETAVPTFGEGGFRLVQLPGFAGSGVLLASGLAADAEIERHPGDILHLRLSAQGRRPDSTPLDLKFRLSLDGEFVTEISMQPREGTLRSEHEIVLPDLPKGVDRVDSTLSIEVHGPPALATIGGMQLQRAGGVPPDSPDVVMFVADTFRADNMSFYRGNPGGLDLDLTPFLDELAEDSLLFEYAWAASSWTLPSHASMFTSMYPIQHRAVASGRRLSERAVTLAEAMRDAGYRTVAVSDGGYCSSLYGLGQGFEIFLEGPTDMRRTTEDVRDVLAADDGRPLFLFVQSYRVHAPYVATPATRRLLEEQIEIPDDYMTAFDATSTEVGDRSDSEIERAVERFRNLYLAGVRDFDRDFAVLWSLLEEQGVVDDGYFLFTSDHGEAFGEHGELTHALVPFESQVRIPLFLRGPKIEAGVDQEIASHIDFAPTLTALAGVPASNEWRGRDLLSSAASDAVFAVQIGTKDRPDLLARARMGRAGKLMTWPKGEGPDGETLDDAALEHFYDLDKDPGEQAPIMAGDDAWPVAWIEATDAAYAESLEALLPDVARRLNDKERERLQALGYLGD